MEIIGETNTRSQRFHLVSRSWCRLTDIQLKRRELNMKGDKVAWDIYKHNLMSDAGLRRTK
jgi:hypothetical protein